MSESTRDEIRQLLDHARDVIRQSQELRRRLDELFKQIEATGYVPRQPRKPAPKRKPDQ